MMFKPLQRIAMLLVMCAISATACCKHDKDKTAAQPAARAPAPKGVAGHPVLAVVNGVALTDLDVTQAFRAKSKEEEPRPEVKAAILETVIRQELLAQKAAALGLEQDDQLQAQLAALQAQMNALRRSHLGEALYRDAIAKMTPVTEADAHAYFDANTARIHQEVHVMEIMERSEQAILAAQAELKAGAAFEEVAQKHLRAPSPGRTPWDLGFLKWKQTPEPWQGAVAKLPIGEASEILRGPASRFWIIKVVARRENGATFDELKAVLLDDLRVARMDSVRAELDRTLMDGAHVDRPRHP